MNNEVGKIIEAILVELVRLEKIPQQKRQPEKVRKETALKIAMEILRDRKTAMTADEIAGEALTRGYATRGKTFQDSIGARLYVEAGKPGAQVRKVGKGLFQFISNEMPAHLETTDEIDCSDRKKRPLTLVAACEKLFSQIPGKPLSLQEIQQELKARNLYQFSSFAKTPGNTISSRLSAAIDAGNPRIAKVGRGYYQAL